MTHFLSFLIFIPFLFSTPTIRFTNHTFTIAAQNGDYDYISTAPDTVTRFEPAQSNAYLAHNGLAGRYFYDLRKGDIVTAGKAYTVKRIDYYRISGENYINEATGEIFDGASLWMIYYSNPDLLVLQTCTLGYDGRMFVVGE